MRHLSWTEAHTDVLHGATLVWAVNSQLLSASFSVLPLLKMHAEEWDAIWRWWRAVHIEGKAACTELITVERNRGALLTQNIWAQWRVIVVVQLLNDVWLFVTPWILAYQASLSFTISQSWLKLNELMFIELVMPSNHLVLCHSLFLLPSIFPSIRVLSNESTLYIKWEKYWASTSASVLAMNIQGWFPLGLTGLISLQSKGLSRVFNTTVQKHQFFGAQLSSQSNSHIHTWPLEKP